MFMHLFGLCSGMSANKVVHKTYNPNITEETQEPDYKLCILDTKFKG